MNSKRFFYSISLTCTLLSLVACNKSESPLPIMSYFKGMENEKLVYIEQNADYDTRIKPHASVNKGDDAILSYEFAFLLDKGNGYGTLNATLAPLSVGVYEIPAVKQLFYSDYESQIAILTGDKTYQPYKSPFTIVIDDIDPSIESSFPHITGRMEGVLYNSENLKDSIVFKNVEFRVW